MIRTPYYKIDALSMPETTHNKSRYDADIRIRYRLSSQYFYAPSLTCERPIDVIHEPCGERHMPMCPKLLKISSEKGPIEIFRQMNSHELCTADCHIAIA